MNISEISDFKKDQLRHELRHEPPNNFAISINGKQWKVFKGKGTYADDSAEMKQLSQLNQWARRKSDETGKKWTVARTGAPASENVQETGKYGNPEKGVQVRSKDSKPKVSKPNPGNESPHPMRGKLVGEADEPKTDKSARAKLDLNLRDRGHKVEPDKKKALKKGEFKHRKSLYQEMIDLEEGPLVLTRDSDLIRMLDTLLKNWLSKGDHSDEEYEKLLKALGYRMEKDGQRTTLVKEAAMRDCPCCDGGKGACSHGKVKCGTCNGTGKVPADFETEEFPLEEAPGAIRKGLAAVAIIASLWGVNNNMAQKAYDASPQLQKLTAYLEVAKQHNDQRMIDQLEQRIENHKLRLDLGKGDVMGKDGRPINVVYDKDVDEAKQRLDPKCWKGYKKQGTKMKGGVRVNNCVPK